MGLSPEAIETLQAGRRMVLRGWCQGMMHDTEARAVCVWGALALGWRGDGVTPIREALHALEDEAGLPHTNEAETVAIAGWNDAPDRTLGDVVGLFDRVLAKAVRQPVMAPSETVDHGETVQGIDDPSFGGDADRPAVGPAGPPVAVGGGCGPQRRAFA